VIGVGHQNLVSRAACDFVGRALRSARLFATRDKETSDLVKRSFRVPVVTAPDLSVVFQDQIASTEAKKERLVTVCGDFREDNDLPDLLAGVQTIGARVQLVAQANEDMTGFEKHRSILQEMKLSIVDCRESQPAEFITRIAQSNALITTRFHALKIALMAGIETGVFCMSRDKRARLLAEISNCPWVRALPTSDGRLKENRNLLLSIAAQGRREPARAVQFDTSSLKIVKEALCAV